LLTAKNALQNILPLSEQIIFSIFPCNGRDFLRRRNAREKVTDYLQRIHDAFIARVLS